MKKTLLISISTFLFSVQIVSASSVSAVPVLIDIEAAPRDIITREITVTNTTGSKIDAYATVNEVSITDGAVKAYVEPVGTDRTNTITSWVEITRARIELEPGQSQQIPLTIQVHPQAVPGEYHMKIGFAAASKRHEAEALAMAGRIEGTLVKVNIDEKQNELLRISAFLIDRFIFRETQREITIDVENTGSSDAVPQGEIIFYNSRGEEVSSLALADINTSIPAGEKRSVTTRVPFDEKLGRYKANLVLTYGNGQQAAVFDTAQFYMIPFPLMVAIAVVILLISVLVTYLLRKVFYDELHEDDDGNTVPLYVRNNHDHDEKDHDINLSQKS